MKCNGWRNPLFSVLFLILGLAAMGIGAQDMGGVKSIRGRVVDEERKPIAGAKVTLEYSEDDLHREVYTKKNGWFRFNFLQSRRTTYSRRLWNRKIEKHFIMTVSAPGYLTRRGIWTGLSEYVLSIDPVAFTGIKKKEAIDFMERREFEKAETACTELLLKYPQTCDLLLIRAKCRKEMGNGEGAENDCRNTISPARESDDLETYTAVLELLGDLMKEKKNSEEADKLYQEALLLDPENAILMVKTADMARERNRLYLSLSLYETALELRPGLEGLSDKISALRDRIAAAPPPAPKPAEAKTNPKRFPETDGKDADTSDTLRSVLNKAAAYCRKLDGAGFRFYCLEKVTSLDHPLPRPKVEGEEPPPSLQVIRDDYLYDYQIVGDKRTIMEKRTLQEKNGKKFKRKMAKLEVEFQSLYAFYTPIDLLGEEQQPKYEYRIKGEETIAGRDFLILEAKMKEEYKPLIPLEGIVWIDRNDGSVQKIEIHQTAIKGLEKRKIRAQAAGFTDIMISDTHWYNVEKEGLHFPSRTEMNEYYLRGDEKILNYQVQFLFSDYHFFQIEVSSKINQ